jgi:hypothetical protein
MSALPTIADLLAPPLDAVAPEALADAWAAARRDSAEACGAWHDAPAPERRGAYAAYLAAADREAAAEAAYLRTRGGSASDVSAPAAAGSIPR